MRIILVIFFALFCVNIDAQSIIQGRVIDSASRQPLEGAIVYEKSNNYNKTIRGSKKGIQQMDENQGRGV